MTDNVSLTIVLEWFCVRVSPVLTDGNNRRLPSKETSCFNFREVTHNHQKGIKDNGHGRCNLYVPKFFFSSNNPAEIKDE